MQKKKNKTIKSEDIWKGEEKTTQKHQWKQNWEIFSQIVQDKKRLKLLIWIGKKDITTNLTEIKKNMEGNTINNCMPANCITYMKRTHS